MQGSVRQLVCLAGQDVELGGCNFVFNGSHLTHIIQSANHRLYWDPEYLFAHRGITATSSVGPAAAGSTDGYVGALYSDRFRV